MKTKDIMIENNQYRELLNEENKSFYKALLLTVRSRSFF